MGASTGDAAAAYDEHPARTVNVDGFWIDRTEVTNAEYRRCVDAGACSPPHRTVFYDDPNQADHPVIWVDWYQAKTYARWAGKRLPTEAEWERAARGGAATRYPWGEAWQPGAANIAGALGEDRWGATAPVASFDASSWGVYDLLGNASEWVEDVYHKNFWNAPRDGRAWIQLDGPPVERRRVVRGGSHVTQPTRLRVSHRDDRAPEAFNRATGFRCAAD
jgi:formylglycine-generating enzyme required for sulfatase activity